MIEKLKQSIIRDISNQLDKVLTGIVKSENKLKQTENDIISKSEEYINLNIEVSELSDELINTRNEVRKGLDKLKEEKTSVKELRVKTDKRVSEAKTELAQLTETTERRSQDLSSIEKEIKSIEPMKKIKDSLEKEVISLNSKVKEFKEEKKLLEISMRDTKFSFDKEISEKKNELSSIQKDIDTEKIRVLPKLEELQEREKAIVEKEKDLRIIEQRWKKLYQDKGKGFKV